jgi:hypothetical protein
MTVSDGAPDVGQRHAASREDARRRTLLGAQQAEQQVLGSDVAVLTVAAAGSTFNLDAGGSSTADGAWCAVEIKAALANRGLQLPVGKKAANSPKPAAQVVVAPGAGTVTSLRSAATGYVLPSIILHETPHGFA